jgi:hypothetical protein
MLNHQHVNTSSFSGHDLEHNSIHICLMDGNGLILSCNRDYVEQHGKTCNSDM